MFEGMQTGHIGATDLSEGTWLNSLQNAERSLKDPLLVALMVTKKGHLPPCGSTETDSGAAMMFPPAEVE